MTPQEFLKLFHLTTLDEIQRHIKEEDFKDFLQFLKFGFHRIEYDKAKEVLIRFLKMDEKPRNRFYYIKAVYDHFQLKKKQENQEESNKQRARYVKHRYDTKFKEKNDKDKK